MTQPVPERLEIADRGHRVPLDVRSLPFIQRTSLVEDPQGHIELPDIVQQRRPAQLVHVFFVQAHLLTDHLGVGTNPIAVTSSVVFVTTDDCDEIGEAGRFQAWIDRGVLTVVAHSALQIIDPAGPEPGTQP